MLLSCVIYTKEVRDVSTFGVPIALLQADMDELIHLMVTGPLAILLTKVDTKLYEKYITYYNLKPVIYVKLTKALYGTIK